MSITKGQSYFNSNNHCLNVGLTGATLAYLFSPCEDSHTNYVTRYLSVRKLISWPISTPCRLGIVRNMMNITIRCHNKRNCYTNTWIASSTAQKIQWIIINNSWGETPPPVGQVAPKGATCPGEGGVLPDPWGKLPLWECFIQTRIVQKCVHPQQLELTYVFH